MTPRRVIPFALFLVVCSPSLVAQPTNTTKPAVHHRRAASSTAATAAKPACSEASVTNPPGTPAVTGPVGTVYALRYVDTKLGDGALAVPGKFYSVHYTGWLADGTKFDSSLDRGQSIEFQQGQHRVIAGWDSGFDGMHVGGKRRLYIPYQLAYGELGRPPIPPRAVLVFDLELVAQSDTPAPPAPPTPPTTPPKPQ